MCQTFLDIDIYSLQHLKFQAERSLIKSQKNCVLMNSQNSVLSYAETILLQKTLKYWYYWSTRHSKDTLTTHSKKIYLTYIAISTIFGN